MRRGLTVLSAIALSAAFAAGCATSGALEAARASFEKSKAAGAEKAAPYEYYQAEEFLKLADHEVQEGDSKQAKTFAEQSEAFSRAALEKAAGGAK